MGLLRSLSTGKQPQAASGLPRRRWHESRAWRVWSSVTLWTGSGGHLSVSSLSHSGRNEALGRLSDFPGVTKVLTQLGIGVVVSVSGHWNLLFKCSSHCRFPQCKPLLRSSDMMICPLAPVVLGRNTHCCPKRVGRAACRTEGDTGVQTREVRKRF